MHPGVSWCVPWKWPSCPLAPLQTKARPRGEASRPRIDCGVQSATASGVANCASPPHSVSLRSSVQYVAILARNQKLARDGSHLVPKSIPKTNKRMDCCNYMQYRHHQPYYGSHYYEPMPYHGDFYGQQVYQEYYGNTSYYQQWPCASSPFPGTILESLRATPPLWYLCQTLRKVFEITMLPTLRAHWIFTCRPCWGSISNIINYPAGDE